MDSRIALSLAQRDMLGMMMRRGDVISLWLPSCTIFDGAVEVQRFRESLRILMARHKALRMQLVSEPDYALQERTVVEPCFIDWSQTPSDSIIDAHGRVQKALGEYGIVGHNLWACFLDRIDEKSVVTVAAHHLIVDGISLGILWRDLDAIYSGSLSALPKLNEDVPGRSAKNVSRSPAIAVQSERVLFEKPGKFGLLQRHHVDLPKATWSSIKRAGLKLHASPFSVLLSAYVAAVARIYGLSRVVVGTPIDRRAPEQSEVIGAYIDAYPIEVTIDRALGLGAICSSTSSAVIEALTSNESRHNANPYDFWMAMHPSGVLGLRSLGSLQGVESIPAESQARYPLRFDVAISDGGVVAELGRDTHRVRATDTESIAADITAFCAALAGNPKMPFAEWALDRARQSVKLQENFMSRLTAGATFAHGASRRRIREAGDASPTGAP